MVKKKKLKETRTLNQQKQKKKTKISSTCTQPPFFFTPLSPALFQFPPNIFLLWKQMDEEWMH
jgi:hypothetical protein